jgi:hypothetical protein
VLNHARSTHVVLSSAEDASHQHEQLIDAACVVHQHYGWCAFGPLVYSRSRSRFIN